MCDQNHSREITNSDVNENRRLYERIRDELTRSQLSNSENYDKSILTLSSAILGLTLSFIGNIVKTTNVIYIWLLYYGWYLLVAAIFSTILSFLFSQKAIKIMMHDAERYYLGPEDNSFNTKNKFKNYTEILNYVSGLVFILGVLAIVIFITTNLTNKTG